MSDRFDIVVAGGCHNSLIAAAYLAKAGFRCLVLEGRPVVGGNCVTEELTLPGFQHDSCGTAHVVIQDSPLVRNDELGLAGANHRRRAHLGLVPRRIALLQLVGERHLRRIGVRGRDLHERAVRLDDVHGAPVGDLAGRELRHMAKRLAVVERLGESRRRVREECGTRLLIDDRSLDASRRRSRPRSACTQARSRPRAV